MNMSRSGILGDQTRFKKMGSALAVLLYAAAVFLTWGYAEVKSAAVAYNPQDYPFYLGFYAKRFQDGATPSHAVNPNGLSLLGFHGTEGSRNFDQAIHFEPVKYALAAIYRLRPRSDTLFAVISLFYFLPVLYAMRVFPLNEGWTGALFALAYVLFPSVPEDVAFDLRPFLLLTPSFALLMLAVIGGRSGWACTGCLILLFLVREEGLVLGATACLTTLLIDQGRLTRWIPMGVVWVVWAGVTACYYIWTDYGFTLYVYRLPLVEDNASIMVPLIIIMGLIAAGLFAAAWAWRIMWRPWLLTIPMAGMAALLGVQMILFAVSLHDSDRSFTESILYRLCGDRNHIAAVSALVLGIIALPCFSLAQKQMMRKFIFVILVAFLMGLIWPSDWSALGRFRSHLNLAELRRPLWSLRENTDPASTRILTDYEGLQVFADYSHAYAYRRLPWVMAPGPGRYWPANRERIIRLIREDADWLACVTDDGRRHVQDSLRQAGAPVSKEIVEDGVWIARIERHPLASWKKE